MSTRVEILNAGINKGRITVRQMKMETRPNGEIVLTPAPGGSTLEGIPGQRCTMHAGETEGQVLLIQELAPDTRNPLPTE